MTWMDEARSADTWNVASWILAALHKCFTAEANKIPFNPGVWNVPERARQIIEQRRQRELQAIAENKSLESLDEEERHRAIESRKAHHRMWFSRVLRQDLFKK